MTVRSLFFVLMFSSITACTTPETYFTFSDTGEGYIELPRPVVTQVTFEENPYTMPHEPSAYSHDETDPCTGRALTEDEVKEYFRIAQPILSGEYKDCSPTQCRVYGHVMLKDGRKGAFEIDLGRQGWLHTSNEKYIYYYCKDCKNEKIFESDPLPIERACSNITLDEWERLDNESQTP